VLFLDCVSHGRLFPRCVVVVHHGGAGTTMAGLRSGRPSIITPIVYDQFESARIIERLGVGIAMNHLTEVTPQVLSEAVITCMSQAKIKENAKELGEKLVKRNGVKKAIETIANFMRNEVLTGRYHVKQKKSDERRFKRQSDMKKSAAAVAD